MPRFVVASVHDFDTEPRRIVRVGGREIGVFRIDGRYFAVRNRCPHQGGPLCAGRIVPRIVSDEPGSFRVDADAPLVVCPWHGWQYDMRSGKSYAPGDPGVKAYDVSVEPGSNLAEGEEGPYTVETFPVYVEKEYVVLDA
jgi:3-phenylpropionate/trans-cinnamate dioxygenase ferredoxin subunit